jgi:hypothetical protein
VIEDSEAASATVAIRLDLRSERALMAAAALPEACPPAARA